MSLSKYGVARHIYIPIVKRAAVDFAISTDWTPAAGDVKISKDGGAFANVTNLPTAINSANTGAVWDFSLTATEMQAAQVMVVVSDAATKAIEDQSFIIETYGNASGQHELDLDAPTIGLPAGAIATTTFAAGAINAAAIATDAIGAAELAADAVTEIQTGLATSAALTALQNTSVIRTGTAQAGSAASITLDAGASAVNSFYQGAVVLITGGTGAGQHMVITSYTGATKVAGVATNWATAPDNTSAFAVLPARAWIDQFRSGAIGSTAFGTAAIDANAIATDALGALELGADAATEIATAVWAQAMSDLAAVPAANASALAALNWVFEQMRNKITQSATTTTVFKDDGATTLAASIVSDDGITMTRGEFA